MASLSDIPFRVQTLAGQIKQADADTAESQVRRDRARQTLEREEATLAKNLVRAAELRKELEGLADEAQAHIRALGLPGSVREEADPLSPGESAVVNTVDALLNGATHVAET